MIPDLMTILAACLTICTFAMLVPIAYWRTHPPIQPPPPLPPPAPIPVTLEVAALLHADGVLQKDQDTIRRELNNMDARQCAWDMMTTKHKFWYIDEVSGMNRDLLVISRQRQELARRIEACAPVTANDDQNGSIS